MKLKLFGLSSFIITILPLGVYTGINWERYAPTTMDTIQIGIGGAIVGFIFLMKAIKKSNLPKGLMGWVVALVVAWTMQAILTDLVNLLFMAVIGEVGDEVFIQPQIKKIEKALNAEEQTQQIAQAIAIATKVQGRV
jgi:uncharacterized membrane protein